MLAIKLNREAASFVKSFDFKLAKEGLYIFNMPYEGDNTDDESVLEYVWYNIWAQNNRIEYVCTPSGNVWCLVCGAHYYFDKDRISFDEFKEQNCLGHYSTLDLSSKEISTRGILLNFMGVEKGGSK